MELTGLFDDSLNAVSTWFSAEQNATFLAQNAVWLAGLFGLLTGVFIAAHYAKKVAFNAANEQRKQALLLEEHAIEGFLQALLVESKIVLDVYQQKIGKQLDTLSAAEELHKNYSQTSDYFCIYNNNTHMLGRVVNNALRLQIVKANTLFKGVLNSLEENNHLYSEYLGLYNLAQSTHKPIDENRVKQQLDIMKKQAAIIKAEHVLMSVQMQQMIDMLRSRRNEKAKL